MAVSCRMNVTWEMCTGLSEIPNHYEKSTLLLVSYMYTKVQTWWHIECSQGWLNSLSHPLLHSQCGNNINISTVVMLGFWFCEFKKASYLDLCLLGNCIFCLVVWI